MVAELETINFDEKSGFRAAWLDDKGALWHFHPEFELVLNLKSNGTRIIGDNVEFFDHYDMILVAGNVPHSWNHYRNDGELPDKYGIICHFSREALGESFLKQHEMASLGELMRDAERGISFSENDARKAEPFLEMMTASTGMEKMVAFFSVMNILCSSQKKRLLCTENYKVSSDQLGSKRMRDVYAYIRENYRKQITLKEVSSIANMSPFAFSRYFKKNSGAGLIEYINQVRSNRACYLLRETDENVHQIARECGFYSISNFNKQFRKFNSITPGEYRDQYR
jgi:AraC-like DNA-binding protein